MQNKILHCGIAYKKAKGYNCKSWKKYWEIKDDQVGPIPVTIFCKKNTKRKKVFTFLKASFVVCLHGELEMCALSMATGCCNPVRQHSRRNIANESVWWWRAVRIVFLNTFKCFPEVHAKQFSLMVWLFLCNREHIKWSWLQLPTKNWKGTNAL